MSVWLESEDAATRDSTSVADVVFKLECQSLPVDHAASLSESICTRQPWLKQLPGVGIHPIHVAGSQNGWQRPETDDQPLVLSKRTRLKIRIEKEQCEKLISSLKNTDYLIDHHHLKILDGRIAPLQPVATLFSRYAVYLKSNSLDESKFEHQVISDCETIGYSPTKILCGRSNELTHNGEKISVRSVMLADVPKEHSLLLQKNGLGDLRLMGCGLLIPHKDTGAVS